MSGDLFNLSILPLNERGIPYSNPIVGTSNTLIAKTRIGGSIKLLGTGSSECGELGVISTSLLGEVALDDTNPEGFSAYIPNITIIGGGENFFGFVYRHNGILIEDEVYTWGKNDKYQLGRGGRDLSGNNILSDQAGPGMITISDITFTGTSHIRTFQSGWTHAHITTNDNRVFSWGDNYYGQLGISYGIFDASINGVEPVEIVLSLGGETVYSVYGGNRYSVALTMQGNVYVYGANDTLQLGISDGGVTDYCENQIQINIDNIVHIAPGDGFIAVLRNDGTVWGWGNDEYGQISLDTTISNGRYVDTPIQITNIDDAVYVSSGKNHIVILRKNGSIATTGDNQHFQSSIPLENKGFIFASAIHNNTFLTQLDGDLLAYGAGIDVSSGLLGEDSNTTSAENPIDLFKTYNSSPVNIDVTTLYTNILNLEYVLLTVEETRELLKFDEDQTPSSGDYIKQKKAICLVKDIARNTHSTITSGEACCITMPNQKPIIRFKSFKEKMAYEQGLYILNKNCLIKN